MDITKAFVRPLDFELSSIKSFFFLSVTN